MKGGRTLFWHSVASCMGATKKRERFLVVHASPRAKGTPHYTRGRRVGRKQKGGRERHCIAPCEVRGGGHRHCVHRSAVVASCFLAVVAALFPVLLSHGWEGEEEERSIRTPFVGKAPFSFSRGRAGGIGGELRKLLSLPLPLSPQGSAGVGWQLRKEREREERFFKRAVDVGAAVWLCLALEAG